MSAPYSPESVRKLRDKARMYLARWWHDPVAYAMEAVGDVPTHQQAELLRSLVKHRFVAARSGHGIGKSRAEAIAIHWYLDTHWLAGQPCRVPCTGAGAGGLADVLWSEVSLIHEKKARWLRDQWILLTDRLQNKELPKQWFAVLRVARRENPDALQGFHRCLYVIDEAPGVEDKVFELAQGAMGDEGSMGIMTGNPTRLDGYFWKVFHRQTMWHRLHFSSLDSLSDTEYTWDYTRPDGEVVPVRVRGLQTREWAESFKKEHGEDSSAYRIRVKGDFGVAEYDAIVEPSAVEKVWGRGTVERKDPTSVRVLAIDPGRYGEDPTGLVVMEGTDVLFLEEWMGHDTVESAERARVRAQEWGCREVLVDANGVGAGVSDVLRRMGVPNTGVMVSEKPVEDGDAKCGILRDWLWWKLRALFNRFPVRFAGRETDELWAKLARELSQPGYKFGGKGEIRVESKEEMRKRGVPSPNLADALAMAMLKLAPKPPLAGQVPQERPEDRRKRKKARLPWNLV